MFNLKRFMICQTKPEVMKMINLPCEQACDDRPLPFDDVRKAFCAGARAFTVDVVLRLRVATRGIGVAFVDVIELDLRGEFEELLLLDIPFPRIT